VSELKASMLIELRETQGNGLTSVELEKKIKISPELISAVLSDLQEDEQVEYDEQTMRWDLPK
jgi:Mn-dependent DtxR family transcriptional regulator